jgi:hypothetical protein
MSFDIYSTRPRAPFNRTGTDFGVRLFTATTTARADVLPAGWDGCMLELYVPVGGSETHYAFSSNASAAVNFALAATDAGASAAAGGILPPGIPVRVFVPPLQNEACYFARDAAGTTSVRITKLSERI